jgi:hypothetical protein
VTEHNGNETGIVAVEAVAIEPTRALEHDPIATAALEMMRANPTPETANQVLSFLERLDATRARKAYAAAMVQLKRDLPAVISKNKRVELGGCGGYVHSTLDHIMATVQPILSEHGFDVAWRSTTVDRGIAMTCRLTHRDGHCEECTTPAAPPDTGPGRNAVQSIGSTLTYLQRYSLVMLLGLSTGDAPDPDDEPREQAPDTIDPRRNNAMVTALRKRGRALADAEKLVGKKSAQWTAADREEVGLWLKGAPAFEPPPPVDGVRPTDEELAEDERRMAREPGAEG